MITLQELKTGICSRLCMLVKITDEPGIRFPSYVQSYKWGTVDGDTPTTIYVSVDPENTHPFLSLYTGHGTLFTSGKKGIVYSESLEKHLYPNYGDATDFYHVDSLNGVYIASQMRDDNSIQSVITYNRGGNWQPIPRPVGVPCKDETKTCNLQIHGTYSLSRGVTANPPLSVTSAVGIILVHGHVADALQTTAPDVFITSDGGYNWRKINVGLIYLGTDNDYETWMAHSSLRKNEPAYVQGCLLGKKEVFKRLKKDSWCFNGYNYKVETTESICSCTREDYECDYGYFRPEGKDDCNKIVDFKNPEIDICLRGHEEKIVTKG
ncbi:hypothetical protein KUTeg_020240 [Tegillarca granosa]|uniref:VPS10 domain-containing protein n=1 Tax=Tegillarca granosa TaxID=220873 RepID=A0ABQ9E7A7_TEGGR|nr:hypothetical protein KUTeg_020240 [Tegillarca granosa]